LIFAVSDHIQQIIERTKTQTRRASDRYRVGHDYAIQPTRTSKGIREGRVLITRKRVEYRDLGGISPLDALAEGGYTPSEFEKLYKKMQPKWIVRYAYTFKFIGEDTRHE